MGPSSGLLLAIQFGVTENIFANFPSHGILAIGAFPPFSGPSTFPTMLIYLNEAPKHDP